MCTLTVEMKGTRVGVWPWGHFSRHGWNSGDFLNLGERMVVVVDAYLPRLIDVT